MQIFSILTIALKLLLKIIPYDKIIIVLIKEIKIKIYLSKTKVDDKILNFIEQVFDLFPVEKISSLFITVLQKWQFTRGTLLNQNSIDTIIEELKKADIYEEKKSIEQTSISQVQQNDIEPYCQDQQNGLSDNNINQIEITEDIINNDSPQEAEPLVIDNSNDNIIIENKIATKFYL